MFICQHTLTKLRININEDCVIFNEQYITFNVGENGESYDTFCLLIYCVSEKCSKYYLYFKISGFIVCERT